MWVIRESPLQEEPGTGLVNQDTQHESSTAKRVMADWWMEQLWPDTFYLRKFGFGVVV